MKNTLEMYTIIKYYIRVQQKTENNYKGYSDKFDTDQKK